MFDFIIAPFAWILKELYLFTGNYGLAIILFALISKVILLYFSARGKRGMMQTQRLQPKQQELQKRYEKDKTKYQQELQKLYQDEGVSMTGGCLWTLLPFPLLMALYGVIRQPLIHMQGLTDQMSEELMNFLKSITDLEMTNPKEGYNQLLLSDLMHQHFDAVKQAFSEWHLINIDYNFLGLNLTKTPVLGFNWYMIIPILSAGSALLAMWVSMKVSKMPQAQGQSKFMMLLSPALSLWFAFMLPSLMGVYWIAQNIFGMIQDYFLTKHYVKIFAEEEARRNELESRRKAAEEAMKEELRQRRAEAIAAKKQKRKPGQTVYKIQKKPKPKDE